jgi:hypothetical protein
MAGDDLELPDGTRLLHIGPHKTGSSALQNALHLARERLAAQGIVYPGRGRQTLLPILAVTGQPALLGEAPASMSHWDNLVRVIAEAGDQRVIVSSEFLAEAREEVAGRVVRELGGPRAHVVATLRPLPKLLPSQWQQYVQNGFRVSYSDWLTGVLSEPPNTPTPGFWRRHRHDEVVRRWAEASGVENFTVVVVDESDRRMLLRTFESFLGLEDGFLVAEDQAENRSLTAAEAEIVRMLNHEFKRREWPDRSYAKFMRYGAVQHMKAGWKPGPAEDRLTTPDWALERAAEIGSEMAKNIAALGVRIVGDLSTLGALTGAPPRTAPVAGRIPVPPKAAGTAETVTLYPLPPGTMPATGAAGTALPDVAPAGGKVSAGGAAPASGPGPAASSGPAASAPRTADAGPVPDVAPAAGATAQQPTAPEAAVPGAAVPAETVPAETVPAETVPKTTVAPAAQPTGWAFRLAESPVEVAGKTIPAEAAARAIVGAFLAGGVAGRTAEESMRSVSTKTLVRELYQRSKKIARRKLHLAR